MVEPEDKRAYFQGREVNSTLVDLYFKRLNTSGRVLDLGCGSGSFGAVNGDIDLVGVDIDLGALETAKTREDVVLWDLESGTLPFHDNAFDGVIAKDVLEHLSNPTDLLEEMNRVLVGRGRAVISVPMAKPKVVWGDYTHVRGFTEDALRTMVRDHGFEVIHVTPMGGIPGIGRLGLTRALPTILRIPGLRRFATSHELVMENPSGRDD